MIDAALDGQYSEQQQVYTPQELTPYDLSNYQDNVGVEKLAHALVHVADNLHDIGSHEEKLAELEAFSHIAGDLNAHIEGGELKLAGYGEFDGLGAYSAENLYEDSLYGARQRALVKMASAYGIPAEDLDQMLKESSALDKFVSFLGKSKAGKSVAKRFKGATEAIAKAESNLAKLEAQGAAKAELEAAKATSKAEIEAAQKSLADAKGMRNMVSKDGTTITPLRKLKKTRAAESKLENVRADQTKAVEEATAKQVAADKAVSEAPIGFRGRIKERFATKNQPTAQPTAQQAPAPTQQAPAPTQPTAQPTAQQAPAPTQQAPAPTQPTVQPKETTIMDRIKTRQEKLKAAKPDAAPTTSTTAQTKSFRGRRQRINPNKLKRPTTSNTNAPTQSTNAPTSMQPQGGPSIDQLKANPLAPFAQPPKNVDLTKVDLKNAKVIGNKAPAAEKGFFDKAKDYMAQPGLGNMNMGQTIGAGAGLVGLGAIGGAALSGGDKTTVVKAASLRKLAEDRIYPAKIRAGKSDPFGGHDIHAPGMSRSASPYEPINIRAQRIRDRINSDMGSYVSNVGGGYNLRKYLSK